MPEQQYEYATIDVVMKEVRKEGLEGKLNEMAEAGWVLDERYELSGSTMKYIFRRPTE